MASRSWCAEGTGGASTNNEERQMRRLYTTCAVVAALSTGLTTFAGPLASDINGLPGFTGSVSFNADDVLLVDVDFAVFAPGDYSGTADPSGGEEYVYAYQAFNESSAQAMSALTIGLLENSGASAFVTDLDLGRPDGIAPTLTSLLETSIIARFLAPQIPAGGHSTVLLYTSVHPPTLTSASVAGGGYSAQMTLPSPIPEPTTGCAVALGGLLLLSRRIPRRTGDA
jgi:hypothetical protein